MTTLALDLGQTIGWVIGSAVGPLFCGSIEMPQTTDLGRWLAGADAPLGSLIKSGVRDHGVRDIAVEMPFLGDSYFPARKLLGLLGHVYYHAHFQGIAGQHVNEIPVATAKKALSGHGGADKDQMMASAVDFWGFEPDEINEHIADASGILKVHLFGEAPSKRKKPRSGKGVSILRGPAR